jgi:hypothetical protein
MDVAKPGQLCIEELNADPKLTAEIWHSIIKNTWGRQEIQEHWKNGAKKGNMNAKWKKNQNFQDFCFKNFI